jgi:hypothetical protein
LDSTKLGQIGAMSDSRGEDADVHAYPGEDRPAGPGAEDSANVRAIPAMEDDDVASPSEMQGHQ